MHVHAQYCQQLYCTVLSFYAGAGSANRKSLAISDEELAQTLLGLRSSSRDEALEAAKLFWPGEELMDVGGDRFYPRRQVSPATFLLVTGESLALTSDPRPWCTS